jgi:hypothetical protein
LSENLRRLARLSNILTGDSDLGSAAVRAKGGPVLDGGVALIAGMFHLFSRYSRENGHARK